MRSPWLCALVPAPMLALLLAHELACQYDDLWREIELGCLLAYHATAARRRNGWPYGRGGAR